MPISLSRKKNVPNIESKAEKALKKAHNGRTFIENLMNEGILSCKAMRSKAAGNSSGEKAPRLIAEAHMNEINARGEYPHPLLSNPTDKYADMSSTIPTNQHSVLLAPYRNLSEREIQLGHVAQRIAVPEVSRKQFVDWSPYQGYVEIDLDRPDVVTYMRSLYDLAPLARFRNLQALAICNMGPSVQPLLWKVVFLNRQLSRLELTMNGDAARLDFHQIGQGYEYSATKPTMREVARGRDKVAPLETLPIRELCLKNFILTPFPFGLFSPTNLRLLSFARCKDEGFHLPREMQGSVTVEIK